MRKLNSTLLVFLGTVLFNFTAMQNVFSEPSDMCGVCGTPIQAGSVIFEITYEDGKIETLGCPGCGISMMSGKGVKSAMTMDFISRKMIHAKKAYYLRGSEIGFCCEPHWLSFAKKSDAEKFAKGFGGEVLNYKQASEGGHDMSHH